MDAVKPLIAFVILTIFLFTQNFHGKYTFDPTSLVEVRYNHSDCTNYGEGGIGCTEAVLIFSKMYVTAKEPADTLRLILEDEKGVWTAIVEFHPKLCREVRGGGFLCKQVSWRVK